MWLLGVFYYWNSRLSIVFLLKFLPLSIKYSHYLILM